MRISITAACAAALLFSGAAFPRAATVLAQASPPTPPAAAEGVQIGHPWARATAPRQDTGAVYLSLNSAIADKLVSASTTVSERAEIHEMTMDNTVMRMRQVPGVALPAGQTVLLQPGGYHLMLIGLKHPLQPGDSFPLQLRFESGRSAEVQVAVERNGATGPTGAGHAGH